MSQMQSLIGAAIDQSRDVIAGLAGQADSIEAVCEVVLTALRGGQKILTAGHGGSAAEAMHMSEELVGRFDRERRPLPGIALVSDGTLLTCIGNDYGFEQIFPRQVEALGQSGDVLVIFSSSGRGEGYLRAVKIAKDRGVRTVGLLGKGGGPLAPEVDLALVVDSDSTARVQEAHTLIMHIILAAVDEAFAE